MDSYVTPAMQNEYAGALFNVFATFARPMSIYLDAKIAVVNTTPSFAGMFGDASQNVATTPVTPQTYIVSGCVLYDNKQPWPFISPGSRHDYQQNKVRESEGRVRLKLDQSGYALVNGAQQVVLDGYTFTIDSTPRPHGLVGSPDRWTFTLLRVDPS